ncbi:MAG: 1-acyl-sn-glycerol-3-phosphate acyltransferase [Gammaproteobacteria bacterium]|nr:1-acyl-sn-glycerol-3-phosphate acyltransferase [Gammaproteobacteria bacterium]
MRIVRFILFNLLSWVFVFTHGLALLICIPFGHGACYAVARHWSRTVSFWLGVICGLSARIVGRENFPDEASVMFIKHSSAYETYLQIEEFPRACWVLKQELLYIPVFGWALKALQSIAIDRSAGGAAVKQVLEQGKNRLERGIWVSIFPEGTRMPPGETRRYGMSGTLLAQEAGVKIVPIAHNAGYHWPRHAKSIIPGEVVFVVGKPFDPTGRDPRELNEEIQAWVENEVEQIEAGNR